MDNKEETPGVKVIPEKYQTHDGEFFDSRADAERHLVVVETRHYLRIAFLKTLQGKGFTDSTAANMARSSAQLVVDCGPLVAGVLKKHFETLPMTDKELEIHNRGQST